MRSIALAVCCMQREDRSPLKQAAAMVKRSWALAEVLAVLQMGRDAESLCELLLHVTRQLGESGNRTSIALATSALERLGHDRLVRLVVKGQL